MAGSFTAQIKRLQDSIDEGNRRTEDANAKLHEARIQAQKDKLESDARLQEMHAELQESQRQEKRLLELLTRSQLSQGVRLHETNEVVADLKAKVDERTPT